MEKPTTLTVEELKEQIEKSFKLKKAYEDAKGLSDKAHYEYQNASLKAATMLENLGLDKFHSESGTFSYKYEQSFKVPKDPESKQLLFDWLRERGLYDTAISVNSMTLNSLLKAEEGNAIEEGDLDFKVPGIERGTPVIKPIMRKN